MSSTTKIKVPDYNPNQETHIETDSDLEDSTPAKKIRSRRVYEYFNKYTSVRDAMTALNDPHQHISTYNRTSEY